MEKIDLTNYEAFFLDFAEGNLSTEEQDALFVFLELHPELKEELDAFDVIELEEEHLPSANLKEALRREESTGLPELDYLMIAEVEGTITSLEKAKLANIIKKEPSLLTELSIYHTAKLKPEEDAVVFDNKSELQRKERKLIVWWQYASAVAAAIVVVFLLSWNINTEVYAPRSFSLNNNLEVRQVESGYAFIVERDTQEKALPKEKMEEKVREQSPAPQYAAVEPSVKKKKDQINATLDAVEEELAETTPQEIDPEKEEEKQVQKETKEPVATAEVDENQLAENKNASRDESFIPIDEFAREKIKTNVLKGKTFSETVIEELAELSNDKIQLEKEKNQQGKTQSFALNIGKFSFSRNK